MDETAATHDAAFDAELAGYLSSCAGAGSLRVLEVLKSSDFEVTEKVMFCGGGAGELGPFVRKRIDTSCGLGHAYELLLSAQRKGLRCPSLPRVLDCWNDGERLNVLMEWLPGVTLEEHVRAHGPSEQLARAVAEQLAGGLGALHGGLGGGASVIHRDLKPQNVMVTGGTDGIPLTFVLIDLGIARNMREGAAADTVRLGTRGYAPPEQFGFGQTDVRTDVYALGAVLCFCLTGEDPAPGAEPRRLMRRAGVSDALAQAVVRAMSFDPAARHASAADLAAAACGRRDGAQGEPDRSPGPAAETSEGRGLQASTLVGRVWNVLLAAILVAFTLASWGSVGAPAGTAAEWPAWFRLLTFGAWLPASAATFAVVVADRRRWRRRVSLPEALGLCAAVSLGGFVLLALVKTAFVPA